MYAFANVWDGGEARRRQTPGCSTTKRHSCRTIATMTPATNTTYLQMRSTKTAKTGGRMKARIDHSTWKTHRRLWEGALEQTASSSLAD